MSRSRDEYSAVDRICLTGDERRFVRAEIQDALAGEQGRDRCTDARPGPGDERDLLGEIEQLPVGLVVRAHAERAGDFEPLAILARQQAVRLFVIDEPLRFAVEDQRASNL